MDAKIACVLFVCALTFMGHNGVDGWRWRIRFRRIVKQLCRPVCPLGCHLATSTVGANTVCGFACEAACGRKKRDLQLVHDGDFFVPLPEKFDFYDKNNDGFITLDEFEEALDMSDDTAKEAFSFADTDVDGKLTEEEFLNGPFVLDNDDTEETIDVDEKTVADNS